MLIMNKEIAVTDRQIVLSIIIVNYNVKEYILNCIQSIQDKIDANRCPYEVIVSDNGSVDGSVEAIRERFPWVKVIENNANLGFGKANNIGAKQAKGEVLFFLNPDTLIVKGIEEMVFYLLKHPNVGVSSPVVFDLSNLNKPGYHPIVFGHIISNILEIIPFFYRYRRSRYYANIAKKQPFYAKVIAGHAMMFNKNAFETIGKFDNSIFMGGEEEDLYLRLVKKHYRIVVNPKASILHYGGRSTELLSGTFVGIIFAKNTKYVLKKHFSYTWIIRYILLMLTQAKAIISNYLKGIASYLFIKKKNNGYFGQTKVYATFTYLLKILMNKNKDLPK